ncbi:MAG: phycobiliprotein lyase [Geitlerinemataceae cyanobacterium]
MEIQEFFQQCAGKWFSQRTSHALPPQELEIGKSDLWIDLLKPDDPAIDRLCQQCGIDPGLAVCGMQTKWEGTVGASPNKESGSALLVAIADGNDSRTGKFLQLVNCPGESPLMGQYIVNTDESIALKIESDTLQTEERLWFVSSNLRERTSIITHVNGSSYASFCSEIRMISSSS